MNPRRSSVLFAASALMALPAAAQSEAAPPTALVEVRADFATPRDAKTLGDLAEAVALFNRLRAMAPQAELRFRVLTRLDRAKAERLSIQVMAPSGRIDVPLDDLSRFSHDPAWAALPADTLVRSRLRDGEVTWRSDVRTPGLPPHVRRLGDLRLQCRLDWGSPLGRRGLLPSGSPFTPTDALCESRFTGALNSQFADRPVLAIDLVHGGRRERLSYFFLHGAGDNTPTRLLSASLDWNHDLKDHMYRLELQDEAWPDEALVEFTFMDLQALSAGQARP
jgi:hypothetical protein